MTARAVFERLGTAPEFTTEDHTTAQRRLRSGEIDAVIVLASYPLRKILAFPSEGRFHLLPIPFDEPVSDYPPSQFTADEYPHLIETGQRIDTVAVSRVLAVRDWPEGSARHGKLARLPLALHARFDRLQRQPRMRLGV